MLTNFQILEKIGQGKFGYVYKAKYNNKGIDKLNDAESSQLPSDKLYALKILNIKEIQKLKFIEQLRNEVEIQSRLCSEYVIKLYFYFYDEKSIYLIQEYSNLGCLFNYYKNTIFSELQVKLIIKQLLESVKYLQENNVVHRDIKLENIILFEKLPNIRLKLTDFSWATVSTKRNLTSICGTPEYLPPEIVLKKQYGNEVDIWSIGIIAYELLFRETPFLAGSEKEIWNNIVYKEINFNKTNQKGVLIKVSRDYRSFVSSCLQKDPTARGSIDQLLSHKWIN